MAGHPKPASRIALPKANRGSAPGPLRAPSSRVFITQPPLVSSLRVVGSDLSQCSRSCFRIKVRFPAFRKTGPRFSAISLYRKEREILAASTASSIVKASLSTDTSSNVWREYLKKGASEFAGKLGGFLGLVTAVENFLEAFESHGLGLGSVADRISHPLCFPVHFQTVNMNRV
jgi:hypothetical protein